MPPDASAEPAPSRTLITSAAEYAAALIRLIDAAREELRFFDPDGRQLDLNAPARIAALERFVAGGPHRRIRLAVHDTEHLTRDCPRFLELLRLHAERIAVNRTEGDAARAQDCFLIADRLHCVRRPVARQPRGVLIIDDTHEVAAQGERFEEIWASSAGAVTGTTLGL